MNGWIIFQLPANKPFSRAGEVATGTFRAGFSH